MQQKKEVEQNNDIKFKKRNNFELKISKTFKNCGENINNAKFLLFNKGNNNNINKLSINPTKKYSKKESLISNKKGAILHSSKRHKKQKEFIKEKEKISPAKLENDNYNILKKKKTYYKTNYSNNKLLYFFNNNIISQFKNDNYENNKENNNNNNLNKNKGSSNNVYTQFRKRAKSNYGRNYLYCNSNNLRKKINVIDKSKLESNSKTKNQNNIQEIIYDTDNEVENNILCLLDKSFKKNRNTFISNKKKKHYGTVEILNDNYLKNLHSSLDNKKKVPIDIGKISNSNSISIIKKTEINQYNINNKDEEELDNEFLQGGIGDYKDGFKNMSTQKVISFGLKDNEQNGIDDNLFTSNNKSIKNKKKKKYIIYNNINYFKNADRNDEALNDKGTNKQIVNEVKNESINSYSSKLSKRCFSSFFKCCFLPD